MDTKTTPDIEHWQAFVRAVSKPGAIVRVDVPHKLESGGLTVWDGHSFGASTQFISKQIAEIERLQAGMEAIERIVACFVPTGDDVSVIAFPTTLANEQ